MNAVVVRDVTPDEWQQEMLAALSELSGIRIAAEVCRDNDVAQVSAGIRFQLSLERLVLGDARPRRAPSAQAAIPWSPRGCTLVQLVAARSRTAIDLVLNLTSTSIAPYVGGALPLGLWELSGGEQADRPRDTAGVFESLRGDPCTDVVLKISGYEPQASAVAIHAQGRTDTLFASRSGVQAGVMAARLLLGELARLVKLGKDPYFRLVGGRNPPQLSEPDWLPPSLVSRHKSRPARHVTRLTEKLLCRKQWFLMFSISEASGNLEDFRPMLPPKGFIWADPFIVSKSGRYFIFVEEMSLRDNRGYLAVIEMDNSGNYSHSVPVLQKDYHLSYPCVFESSGKLFMIPESKQNATVDLYECVDFPTGWRKVQTLLSARAVDTTPLHFDGKWWLFTNLTPSGSPNSDGELSIFSAPEIMTSDWEPHALNPVVRSVRSARGAGAIYRRDGKLVRPTQDCSVRYGFGIRHMQIDTLSQQNFNEREVDVLFPWADELLAVHTFAQCGPLTVIDAQRRIRRL